MFPIDSKRIRHLFGEPKPQRKYGRELNWPPVAKNTYDPKDEFYVNFFVVSQTAIHPTRSTTPPPAPSNALKYLSLCPFPSNP